MNFRRILGLRNQDTPAASADEPKEQPFAPDWDASDLDPSNNVLVAAIGNLLANVLASGRPQRAQKGEIDSNLDILGAPPPSLSADPWTDFRSWLRIIVHALLLNGKIWFVEEAGGYRLGRIDLGAGGTQLDTVSFTPTASIFDPAPVTAVVPVNRVGVIQTVGPNGKPVALLGDSAKTACIAYQKLLKIVGEKISNEPNVVGYLSTDSAAMTDSTTEVRTRETMRDRVKQSNNKGVDLTGAFGKLTPLAKMEPVKALEALDRNLTDTLSAYLSAVLNVLGIPKEIFNVHVSHTGTVHGDVVTQFVKFGAQPLADTIVAGLNAYHRRRSQRPTVFVYPLSPHAWVGDLYLSKVAPMKDVLTRDEIRARLYAADAAPADAVFAGQGAGSPAVVEDEEDEDRDRTTRDREQEVSNLRLVK